MLPLEHILLYLANIYICIRYKYIYLHIHICIFCLLPLHFRCFSSFFVSFWRHKSFVIIILIIFGLFYSCYKQITEYYEYSTVVFSNSYMYIQIYVEYLLRKRDLLTTVTFKNVASTNFWVAEILLFLYVKFCSVLFFVVYK